jgi:uncharacterized protein YjiS (DUF1127 family)
MLIETLPFPESKSAGRGLFLLQIMVNHLSDWRWRARTRRQLAMLDAYGLKDLGLTLMDQRIECAKPFWRG